MKIDFSAPLISIKGEKMKDTEKADLALKDVCIEALMAVVPSDERTSGETKYKRFQLAEKIVGGGEVELTPDEAVILKDRIGVCYGPAVVGPAYKLLNG